MHFVIKVLLLLVPWEISAKIYRKHARLSLADPMPSYYYNRIGSAGTYGFGYDVSDPASGNSQFRNEERFPNGTVVGSYGYIDPTGKPVRYRYIADRKGYRLLRDRPFTLSAPAIIHPSSSPGEQKNEITWTRKPKHDSIINPYTERILEGKKFMEYPFKYFYQSHE